MKIINSKIEKDFSKTKQKIVFFASKYSREKSFKNFDYKSK